MIMLTGSIDNMTQTKIIVGKTICPNEGCIRVNMSSLLQCFQYRGLRHKEDLLASLGPLTWGNCPTYPLFWFESGYVPN